MSPVRRVLPAGAAAASVLVLFMHCGAPDDGASVAASSSDPVAAWEVVYTVLQHPRCMNCHPVGDAPLQGDASVPHAQNVQRGADGHGKFAMRCETCHSTENASGLHLPPGAPHWHLPHPDEPLVFEGLSSGALCRQLRDPEQNGGRTPEQLLEHMRRDPLVLWGWEPGEGRAPVPVPHADFVAAVRAWVVGDCACPD